MDDTTPTERHAVRDAILRRSPAERVHDMLEFSERMRELSLRRLRASHPDHTTFELVELLVGRSRTPRATQTRLESQTPELLNVDE